MSIEESVDDRYSSEQEANVTQNDFVLGVQPRPSEREETGGRAKRERLGETENRFRSFVPEPGLQEDYITGICRSGSDSTIG